MTKVFSLLCTQPVEMVINLNRGYMLLWSFQPRGEVWTTEIFQITQRTQLFVPLFTHLPVSFLPQLNLIPDLSLLFSFFLLLSSLSLIFLWISVVPPNPSVPLSCLSFFPFQFHLCALAHRWLRGVLALLFLAVCVSSVWYLLNTSCCPWSCQCNKFT